MVYSRVPARLVNMHDEITLIRLFIVFYDVQYVISYYFDYGYFEYSVIEKQYIPFLFIGVLFALSILTTLDF